MYKDLETIRMTAQALAIRNPQLKEDLLFACESLWEQMYETDAGEAFDELKTRARSLANQAISCHSIESSVVALNGREAERLGEEILEFAAGLRNAKKVLN